MAILSTEVVEQVKFVVPVMPAVGTLLSIVTLVVAVAVQPFDAVTVTV